MEEEHEQLCSYCFCCPACSGLYRHFFCLWTYLKVFFPFTTVAYHLCSEFSECQHLLLEHKSFTPMLHIGCVQRKKEGWRRKVGGGGGGGGRYSILLQHS